MGNLNDNEDSKPKSLYETYVASKVAKDPTFSKENFGPELFATVSIDEIFTAIEDGCNPWRGWVTNCGSKAGHRCSDVEGTTV